jgi:hypothetical protein
VKRCLVALLLFAGFDAEAPAQTLLEVLEADYRIESRLFDGELARYDEARRREREAHQALRTKSDRLDRLLRTRRGQLETLDQLEREVAEAGETAYAATRELATKRQQLYRRMARLAELDSEIRRERDRQLVPESRLDGFGELEIAPTGGVGLLKLSVEGTLVTGTYRLSGNRQGSVRGTASRDRLSLERIDAASGFDSVLQGEFNPATRKITGEWTAVDLSGGRLGGGTWTARKLSPAEEETLRVDDEEE